MRKSSKTNKIGASTFAELKELQNTMAAALFRPLTPAYTMQKTWTDGVTRTASLAERFIKPNDRLTSFDRLEIYNRCCWFRLLDCLYDDYPGLRAILGRRKFMALCKAYLTKHPSTSFTLRDLGNYVGDFIKSEPQWTAPHTAICWDMFRFEWAQIVAFDGPSAPTVTTDELLDTPPDRMRLGLQPYLTLLDLEYTVDDFLITVKKRESESLRSEASNTPTEAPGAGKARRRPKLPRAAKAWLAVHRCDNVIYYKRLDFEAYSILTALAAGKTLEVACTEAITASERADLDWAASIQEWFANWSALGWFCQPLP